MAERLEKLVFPQPEVDVAAGRRDDFFSGLVAAGYAQTD
jgi:hypothetical protein